MKLLTLLITLLPLLTAGCFAQNESASSGTKPGPAGVPGKDGKDGKDAILSSGPIGTTTSTLGVSACHHDFAYTENGWLLVRHQKNGTADQGAGTTGFNLWTVDILDFLLISEVGSVTYCTLRFDNVAVTLEYTVNYSGDGKLGEHGFVDLLTGDTR